MRVARRWAWHAGLAPWVLAAVAVGDVHAAGHPRTLCGWWLNPTPQNVWLIDRSGEWTVSVQGGHAASGTWPDFADRQWVVTSSGMHGYGCACLHAVVDVTSRNVEAIRLARVRPLRACRSDSQLPPPR